MLTNLDYLHSERKALPFKLVQLDDGYQVGARRRDLRSVHPWWLTRPLFSVASRPPRKSTSHPRGGERLCQLGRIEGVAANSYPLFVVIPKDDVIPKRFVFRHFYKILDLET